MQFGKLFEQFFVNQGFTENRMVEQSIDLGWKLLSTLPRTELDRVDDALLDEHYIDDPDSIRFDDFGKAESSEDNDD